jgi:hypothetical protein
MDHGRAQWREAEAMMQMTIPELITKAQEVGVFYDNITAVPVDDEKRRGLP